MPAPFFDRLKGYYAEVAKVLRGEAAVASIFPNSTDIGSSRERAYAEFLRQHCPSKCNVYFGGYVFDEDGAESGQMDVIVTADNCPQFNFHNKDGSGKTFAGVEGTLACVCIKSTLDKAELFDCLEKFKSIPPTRPLDRRILFGVKIGDYDDWPFKIIYASDGLIGKTIIEHMFDYYSTHPEIQEHRRPNIIHVAGKYFILRAGGVESMDGRPVAKGSFITMTDPDGREADVHGIAWTIDGIQNRALASSYILYNYGFIMNKLQEK